MQKHILSSSDLVSNRLILFITLKNALFFASNQNRKVYKGRIILHYLAFYVQYLLDRSLHLLYLSLLHSWKLIYLLEWHWQRPLDQVAQKLILKMLLLLLQALLLALIWAFLVLWLFFVKTLIHWRHFEKHLAFFVQILPCQSALSILGQFYEIHQSLFWCTLPLLLQLNLFVLKNEEQYMKVFFL